MKNVLEFKGYTGSVEFSAEDKVFFGKIVGLRDVVIFEGETVKQLTKAFHEAVEDYLESCKTMGKDPDKEFKGSFNVRLSATTHRLAAMKSAAMKISLNNFVERAIAKEVLSKTKN